MSPAEPDENLHEVRSPAAGNFHRAPAPGEGPYAEVGDVVDAEQTLCIVETLRPARSIPDLPADYPGDEMVGVVYEVEAEVPGEVVGVLVDEAGEVGRDQVLFRLRSGV